MFSTKTAAISNEEFSNSSYMPVGINQNITLKEVNCNKSPQGLDFLEIVFENENGQTATMTEWKNTKGMYIKTDEDLQKRDNAQFGRVCQILDCFYPQRPDAELSTFKEMIDWTKQMLDPMIATKKKLRLKVIYDKKGYTQVSKLGIFVEDMSNTDSQIKLFKNDLMERPVVADKENNDPLNVPPTVTDKENNDPLNVPPTVTPETADAAGASDLPF